MDLEVKMFDAENHPFDNFSSLHLHWESSDSKLLPLPDPINIDHRGNTGGWGMHCPACDMHVTWCVCGAAVLRVHVGNESGTVKVKVTCVKHIQSYLQASDISFRVSGVTRCYAE